MTQNLDTGAVIHVQGDTATLSLRVPLGYAHCEGHFPGDPLVPGVTQVAWATKAVEALAGAPLPPYRIARFKFRAPIRPGADVVVMVTRSGATFDIGILADRLPAADGSLTLLSPP